MEKKYLINLECSIQALAELIALGLEKHCTITKLEMFEQPAEEKQEPLPPHSLATETEIGPP